jgi:hypothetical protein
VEASGLERGGGEAAIGGEAFDELPFDVVGLALALASLTFSLLVRPDRRGLLGPDPADVFPDDLLPPAVRSIRIELDIARGCDSSDDEHGGSVLRLA